MTLDLAVLTGLLAGTLRCATPLLWAALGEAVAERSGVRNIGLEGIMLVGALLAVLGAIFTGSPWAGLAAAAAAGALLGAVHGLFAVALKVDQLVSGVALVMLGLGLSGFGYRLAVGAEAETATLPALPRLSVDGLSDLPMLGPVLFRHDALVYLALLLVPVTWWVLQRSRLGLEIRAVGESPEAADSAGIPVNALRFACVLLGGTMAGIGGAAIVAAQPGGFAEGMTAGRGFIAVACVMIGRWNPWGVLLAALAFGAAEAAQMRLPGLDPGMAPLWAAPLWAMLPYLLAVLLLVLVAGRGRGPKALGRPFASGR